MGLVDGKFGIVTGAAAGIGRATALCFAAEGASVVVCDLESQRLDGEGTVALIEKEGGRAMFVACDVSNEQDQRRLVQECVSAFGRLDFAHNNAGIELLAPLEETTADDWDMVINVNLRGVWLGMKYQVAKMREQGGGSIVNTASVAGLIAVRHRAAYIASKHGVVGLTKAAALDAGDAGIRVNCVCPTAIRTPPFERLDPDHQARLLARQPIRRLAEPREVAEAVVWLASDRASIITGTALAVDLGVTAGRVS